MVTCLDCSTCIYGPYGIYVNVLNKPCFKCKFYSEYQINKPIYTTTSTSTTPIEGAGATNYTKELNK